MHGSNTHCSTTQKKAYANKCSMCRATQQQLPHHPSSSVQYANANDASDPYANADDASDQYANADDASDQYANADDASDPYANADDASDQYAKRATSLALSLMHESRSCDP